MLRITKMTDYAVLILANLALHNKKLLTAKEIASETHISLPTTQKILKKLNRKNLVISKQGASGGYALGDETKDLSELLGQIVLGGNLGAKKPTNRILDLAQNATQDITSFPEGWGVNALDLDEYSEVESPYGDSPLVWVSLTTPLKHGLSSRSGVISSDRSLEIASTNQVRWDGHHLVTGSTDGLGVVLVARSFGLFSHE